MIAKSFEKIPSNLYIHAQLHSIFVQAKQYEIHATYNKRMRCMCTIWLYGYILSSVFGSCTIGHINCVWVAYARARDRSTIPNKLQNKSTLCNAQWNQIARVNEDFYQNNNTTANGEYCHLEQSTRIVESVNNCFLVVLPIFFHLYFSFSLFLSLFLCRELHSALHSSCRCSFCIL